MTDWNETGSVFAPANQEKFDPPTPTPLERLEKWRVADSGRNWCMKSIGRQTYYAASLTEYGCVICSGTGDTLDAAILAALVQAEEKTHE